MTQHRRQMLEGILFTDQYQLSMAQLYFRMGYHEKEALFDHYYRENPDYGSHQAGYCVSAGLAWLLEWMDQVRFGTTEIDLLRSQTTATGDPFFAADFLAWLRERGSFEAITLRAIPEGRVIHPQVPLTVVQGPLAMAQILETALLNQLNYQILIATKAARVAESCRGRLLLEFGLRRAHDLGANAGARAALIGGADFSSNVGLSHWLGLPPKGTHAHSMVQLFMALGAGELEAFRAYADVYPDDCLLLVDTVNTLESGVPNAIQVFSELRRRGHRPVGVRLDSGDLAYLSLQTAKQLDAAGFSETVIVLSNNLDELTIWQIMTQIEHEAPRYDMDADQVIRRLVYGVGTRLITSAGDSALGGVYKLVAVADGGGWQPAIKLSDSPAKMPNPGHKSVWRVYDQRGRATADLLALDGEEPGHAQPIVLHSPLEPHVTRTLEPGGYREVEPLLVTYLDQGRRVAELPTLEEMRQRRQQDQERLDPGVRRLVNPHIYHVSLTPALYELKQTLIRRFRSGGA